MSEPRDLPVRRAQLLDAHEILSEQHAELRNDESAMLEHREHRDALIEHRDRIAGYNRDLVLLPEAQRERLQLNRATGETEEMLRETLGAIEKARAAWKRATDAWQQATAKLDKKS